MKNLHARKWFNPLKPILTVILLLSFVLPVLSASETGNAIAVMDLTSDGTVSTAAIDSVCDIICKTVSSNKFYEVFDRKFLPFTLQSLGRPEHPDCSETPCLIDIGRDIGAKYIIGGSIQRVKAGFFIRLTLIDTELKKPVGTISKIANTTPKAFINQKLPSIVSELLALNKKQESPKTAVYATTAKPAPAASSDEQPIKRQAAIQPETDNTQPQEPEIISDTNKKPRMESKESSAAMSGKKEKPNSLPVRIGASAVVVGAAAVVYYFKFMEGSSSGGDDFISLDDAPNHGR